MMLGEGCSLGQSTWWGLSTQEMTRGTKVHYLSASVWEYLSPPFPHPTPAPHPRLTAVRDHGQPIPWGFPVQLGFRVGIAKPCREAREEGEGKETQKTRGERREEGRGGGADLEQVEPGETRGASLLTPSTAPRVLVCFYPEESLTQPQVQALAAPPPSGAGGLPDTPLHMQRDRCLERLCWSSSAPPPAGLWQAL